MTLLGEILETKRAVVSKARERRPLDAVRRAAESRSPPRSLAEALSGSAPRIIAEVKRASPSRGLIRADFDPVAIARAYERGGAAAVSVLTDVEYFRGSLADLEAVRAAVDLPILRKDFFIDPYQVWEARAAGADAILLILAALDDDRSILLRDIAQSLGMEILWEIHDAAELERVRAFAPKIVGINNRDLGTFAVDLETTKRLAPSLPPGSMAVAESGFSSPGELREVIACGAHAFLIGETLMRAADPSIALRALIDGVRGGADER